MAIEKTITVERDIFINAFPKSLTQDVYSLLDKLRLTAKYKSTECFQINYDRDILNIPYRIYYDEPLPLQLTDKEQLLLSCIFTRHHNGYIREKHLKNIITTDTYLTTPFIAQLLGEYVIEILNIIKDNLSATLLDNLIRLKTDNKEFFYKTEQRIQSYWDCYYRRKFWKKTEYVGFEILKAISDTEQKRDID